MARLPKPLSSCLRFSGPAMAQPRSPSPARCEAAAALAQPVARSLADLGFRLGAVGRAADRDHHRAAVLYRVRAAVRPGHSGRRRLAEAADLRLAHRPVVAVPAQPGPARRARPDPDPRRAGQTVVGHPAAVRLAAGTVDRPTAGTHFTADAGRRDPVRDRHRRAEHPVRLHLRVQLLHRPLLRRLGVHRRFRDPHRDQDSRGCAPACGRMSMRDVLRTNRADTAPEPHDQTGWSPPTPRRRR